jgi:hypothetical protein
MTRQNPEILALFAGADAAHYTLPDKLRELRQARDRTAEWYSAAAHAIDPAALDDAVRQTAAAVADQARRGDLAADWAKPIHAAHDDVERRRLELEPLRRAAELAERELSAAVVDGGDEIILDHLRPALAEVIDSVRELGGAVLELPLEDPAALVALDDARAKVFRRARALEQRYKSIRRAQQALMALADVRGELHCFAMVNPVEVYGEDRLYNRNLGSGSPAPKGSPIRYLVWIATGLGGQGEVAPEPWIPTASTLIAAEEALRERRQWSDRSQTLGVYVPPALG